MKSQFLILLTFFLPMESSSPQIFSFVPVDERNLIILQRWFDQPHVQKWWPVINTDELYSTFLKRIRSADTRGFIVYLKEIPIGYIQYYQVDRSQEKAGRYLPKLPDYTVGTDQFIGDAQYLSKGYGTFFIKQFIRYLRSIDRKITTIIVDPDPENGAAIRCYEKVGFKEVGEFKAPFGSFVLMRYDF